MGTGKPCHSVANFCLFYYSNGQFMEIYSNKNGNFIISKKKYFQSELATLPKYYSHYEFSCICLKEQKSIFKCWCWLGSLICSNENPIIMQQMTFYHQSIPYAYAFISTTAILAIAEEKMKFFELDLMQFEKSYMNKL